MTKKIALNFNYGDFYEIIPIFQVFLHFKKGKKEFDSIQFLDELHNMSTKFMKICEP